MNLAAFASAEPKEQATTDFPPVDPNFFLSGDATLPGDPNDDVFDLNGLWVPHFWRANVKAWEKLALCVRQKMSADRHAKHLEKLEAEAAKKPKVQRQAGSKFTTAYAIKWGRAKGWRLIARETWSFERGIRRSHDVDFGMDAIFLDPATGARIGVQGAGRSERKVHLDRFEERGGIKPSSKNPKGMTATEVAKVQGIQIYYVEFERGDFEPILVERWV